MNTGSFDEQAEHFDRRAGLPAAAVGRVAAAVIEHGGPRLEEGGRLLEVGAGTGEIGARLLARGVDYLALDSSAAMLEVFAHRIDPAHRGRLLHGDANDMWPVEDGQLDALFMSRVAHLLDPHALWREAVRTASPRGCWLLLGRRARNRDSVRSTLRRHLHTLLTDAGLAPRGGGGPRRLISTLEARGGHSGFEVEVARWPVVHRPVDALAAWTSKSGLAGIEVPPATHKHVLDQLTDWARGIYGDLRTEYEDEEWYELHGLQIPTVS